MCQSPGGGGKGEFLGHLLVQDAVTRETQLQAAYRDSARPVAYLSLGKWRQMGKWGGKLADHVSL